MIPCIGVALYNRPDLWARLVHSIDFPVGELRTVNNGSVPLPTIENPNIKSQSVENFGVNVGTSGAWNAIMSYALEHGTCSCVLICGNDLAWAPGDLDRMWQTYLDFPEADFIFGNHSFSNFLVKRSGFEKVGWFWEELYPAYWEDGDFWTRIIRTSAKAIHAAGLHATHEGSATIKSDTAIARLSNGRFQHNARLYADKWGYANKVETFATPYNRGGNVNEWQLSEERMKLPYFRTHG